MFPDWGTKRSAWRDTDIEITGDMELAARYPGSVNISIASTHLRPGPLELNPGERLQSGDKRGSPLECAWNQRVVGPCAALFPLQKACVHQNFQVVRDGGLAQVQRFGEVTYAGFAAVARFDNGEQPQAIWIRESLEDPGRFLRRRRGQRGLAAGLATELSSICLQR